MLDATPVGEAVDDVRSTVTSSVEGVKGSVREALGPRLSDSTEDVGEAGSLLDRILGRATGLVREGMSGETSAEEFQRKTDGSLYDMLKDSATTADDVGGTGALSELFGIADEVDALYESATRKLEEVTGTVEGLVQDARELGQSAREGIGSLLGLDDTGEDGTVPEQDIAAEAASEEPPAIDIPEPEESERLASEDPEETGPVDERDVPPSDDGADFAAEEPAASGQRDERPTPPAAGPGASAGTVGVIDIDDYESTSVEALNRQWDAEHRRVMRENGAVEVGVVRLEDPEPEAEAQERAPAVDPRMVDFAMSDGARSRAISAHREDAELARLALSSASLDRSFQQYAGAPAYRPTQPRAYAGGGRSVSASASAGCQAEEARIQQLMERATRQLTGASICQTARDSERVLREVLAFYERCPINDPGGEMRRWAQESIASMRQTQASVCAG
jgi:hypothetical protein